MNNTDTEPSPAVQAVITTEELLPEGPGGTSVTDKERSAAPPELLPARDWRRRHRIGRRYRIGRRWSWPQRAGGIVIAGACTAAVAWYVPRVVADDRGMLTGTVTSSGMVTLNFSAAGVINNVKVYLGQHVHKGQVLATEYAPNVDALVQADRSEIGAVQAKIAELKTVETEWPDSSQPSLVAADNAQIVSEQAQMAVDNAQLVTDRMRVASTEIVAPSAGVIVAANGQPGEDVTPSGIRDYTSPSQSVPAQQQPQFSLVPEGPQPVSRAAASGSSLPVIALRVSSSWQVIALIPETSVQSIKPGQAVRISVPAARINDVRGQFEEVLPNPETTSAGTFYQVVVAVSGTVANPPLDGMAASVRVLP
jgi:multidrug resistance efflux pump